MKCPSCGKEEPEWVKFCSSCGSPMVMISEQSLAQPAVPEMIESTDDTVLIDQAPYEAPKEERVVIREVKSTELPTMVFVTFVFLIVIGSMVGVFIGYYLGVSISQQNDSNIDDDPTTQEEPIVVVLSSASVTQVVRGTGESITVWDASFQIQGVSPNYKRIEWSMIRVSMISSSGSGLIWSIAPVLDEPLYYCDEAPIQVEIWFVDIQGDGKTNAGDGLKITGMSEECEGATVQVIQSSDLIASMRLPTDFP